MGLDKLAEGPKAREMGKGGGALKGDDKKGRTADLRRDSDTRMVDKLSRPIERPVLEAKPNPVIHEAMKTGDYTVTKNPNIVRIRPGSKTKREEN